MHAPVHHKHKPSGKTMLMWFTHPLHHHAEDHSNQGRPYMFVVSRCPNTRYNTEAKDPRHPWQTLLGVTHLAHSSPPGPIHACTEHASPPRQGYIFGDAAVPAVLSLCEEEELRNWK